MVGKSFVKISLLLSFILALVILSFIYPVYSENDITFNIPLPSSPHGIAINPETDIVVIASEKTDSVSIVDLNTRKVIATIPVGKLPKAVAIDRKLNIALVSNSKDNSVTVIDLKNNSAIKTIPVGKEPEGIAVDQVNHIVLVTNHKDGTVSIIDLATHTILDTIPVGKEPKDIAIDPELKLALVVNEKGQPETEDNEDEDKKEYTVSVIDLNTYLVTGTIPVGKKPQAIDINPEAHIAVITNEKENSITVIDLKTWQKTAIPTCKHPENIAINQLDNNALVICDEDKSLLIIDLNTNTILKEYVINKQAEGIAVNNYTNIAGIIDEKEDTLTLLQLSNPIPYINVINPAILYRGDNNIRITIEGSYFLKTSTIQIQSIIASYLLKPIFIDNRTLEVEIPQTMLNTTGTYQLTVSNHPPEGGASNPYIIEVINPAPQLSVLMPLEVIAGMPEITLTIYGKGFFNETILYINGKQRQYIPINQNKLQVKLTAEDLEYGRYIEITASNPPPGGGLSRPAIFTVLNPIPSLASISPTLIRAGSPDFALTLTGDNYVKTSIVRFNNQQYQTKYISKAQIEATIPTSAIKIPGTYPIKVINPVPGGGQSISLPFTVKPPLEINITSPVDGVTINRSKTIIKGTIKSDTVDIGITVNGIIAEIKGNEWIVNDVPLNVGANRVTATVTDASGNTDKKTITINTNDTTQRVELSASSTSGIVPLTITFTATTSFTPVSYQIDFNGDGIADYTGATFNNITYTYTTEDIYYPTITITDNQGNTYSDTIAITVLNKIEMDTLLKVKWEGMKAALKNGNIEDALKYFAYNSRDAYKQQFNALAAAYVLPIIVNDLGNITFIKVMKDAAEYDLRAIRNGKTYSFYVLFIKDTDGIWRIRSF
jgi:YVTN family beta-propeller protein